MACLSSPIQFLHIVIVVISWQHRYSKAGATNLGSLSTGNKQIELIIDNSYEENKRSQDFSVGTEDFSDKYYNKLNFENLFPSYKRGDKDESKRDAQDRRKKGKTRKMLKHNSKSYLESSENEIDDSISPLQINDTQRLEITASDVTKRKHKAIKHKESEIPDNTRKKIVHVNKNKLQKNPNDFETQNDDNNSNMMNWKHSAQNRYLDRSNVSDNGCISLFNNSFKIQNNGLDANESKHLTSEGRYVGSKLSTDNLNLKRLNDIPIASGDHVKSNKYSRLKKKNHPEVSENMIEKMVPNNNLVTFDGIRQNDESNDRSERDIRGRHQNMKFYNSDNNDIGISRGGKEYMISRGQDTENKFPNSIGEENIDEMYVSNEENPIRNVNIENQDKPQNSYFDDNSKKLFPRRAHLSRLEGKQHEDSCMEIKDHVITSTSLAPETSSEKITSKGGTVPALKMTSRMTNHSRPTLKPSEESHDNLNHDKVNEYEQFLNGQLVDDFVKQVLTKVKRSRKIMRELGFSNDSDATCERCVETKLTKIPDLDEMRKSMDEISTHDALKCYRVPFIMEQYLNLLLSFEQDQERSFYNETVPNNSFIFTDHSEIISRDDIEVGLNDKYRVNSFDKQRVSEDEDPDEEDIFVKSVLRSTLPSEIYKEGSFIETTYDKNKHKKLSETDRNANEKSGLHSENTINNIGLNDLVQKSENHSPDFDYFGNKPLSKSTANNNRDKLHYRSGHGNSVEEKFQISNNKIGSSSAVGREPKKHDPDSLNSHNDYNEEVDMIEKKNYQHREHLKGKENGSINNHHLWDVPRDERRSFPNTNGRLHSVNTLHRGSARRNPNYNYNKNRLQNVLPNEYNRKEYEDNSMFSLLNNWGDGEYELYPLQKDIYLDNPFMSNKKEFENNFRMVKRNAENEPTVEEDEIEPILFDVPDEEYDLFY